LCAGGDGSLKLFDVANNVPVKILKEHAGEVFGCEWNHINKRKILSASYDKSIKLWDITGPGASERTFMHDFVVY
jgi:WD40 repeat protein